MNLPSQSESDSLKSTSDWRSVDKSWLGFTTTCFSSAVFDSSILQQLHKYLPRKLEQQFFAFDVIFLIPLKICACLFFLNGLQQTLRGVIFLLIIILKYYIKTFTTFNEESRLTYICILILKCKQKYRFIRVTIIK